MNNKEFIDKIIFESGLFELNIKKKEIIGSGNEHDTYNMETMPGYIVKHKHNRNDNRFFSGQGGAKKIAAAYKLLPDIIAKTVIVGNNWVVVEKLDTKKLENDLEILWNKCNIRSGLPWEVYKGFVEDNELQTMYDSVAKLGNSWIDKFEQFATIGEKIKVIDKITKGDPDLIYQNMGYSSDNKIKLFDI